MVEINIRSELMTVKELRQKIQCGEFADTIQEMTIED